DFDQALQRNPHSRAALQNKASVLEEYLERRDEALATLDKIIALYPDYVLARARPGIILARLAPREAPHPHPRASLPLDDRAATHYQVAGIYALTSQQQAEDRREAYRLLKGALLKGYGFDLLEKDPDLKPIRGEPEFSRLVEAARSLRTDTPTKPDTGMR